MFLKSGVSWNVIIPPHKLHLDAAKLHIDAEKLKEEIIVQLMDDFAMKKATKGLGYFMAVNFLKEVGDGIVREDFRGEVLFPVMFICLTFKIFKEEVLEGNAYTVMKHGVFLRCGPVKKIYLSHQKMPGYSYFPGDKPYFRSINSTIQKDVTVRFRVIGVRFMEDECEFQAVVGIDGPFLGPV